MVSIAISGLNPSAISSNILFSKQKHPKIRIKFADDDQFYDAKNVQLCTILFKNVQF
ncbi:hypothetical protein GGD38_000135 [Chitinophagaceae bacterium OAS944]|nr:hypothetical protein [Chitinophagaceae bacterium OAS944]